jgi:hypothetical protein
MVEQKKGTFIHWASTEQLLCRMTSSHASQLRKVQISMIQIACRKAQCTCRCSITASSPQMLRLVSVDSVSLIHAVSNTCIVRVLCQVQQKQGQRKQCEKALTVHAGCHQLMVLAGHREWGHIPPQA